MKKETALKLSELLQSKRVTFEPANGGFSVDYDLSDDELRQFVELEYGQTSQDIVQLFTKICTKLVKIAADLAKEKNEQV